MESKPTSSLSICSRDRVKLRLMLPNRCRHFMRPLRCVNVSIRLHSSLFIRARCEGDSDMKTYNISSEWCHKKNQDKFCSKMLSYVFGYDLGKAACYNPEKKKICFGLECILNACILYEDKEKVIDAIIDSIRHKEDARAQPKPHPMGR
jgi:hypothetical protein